MSATTTEVEILEGENQTYGYRMVYGRGDRFVGEWMAQGMYEPADTQVWAAQLRPDSVVLDIGACLGHYALVAGTRVDPAAGGRIYAFEPQPDTFALLRRNVEMNAMPHVEAVNAAVGASRGKLHVLRSGQNWGGHEVYGDPTRGDRQASEVEVVDVDSFIAERGIEPTLVKMDVEGYEYFALQGMMGLLESDRPLTLFMEFFPAIAERARETLGEGGIAKVWQILRSHFTHVYWVDGERWIAPPADYATLLDRCSPKTLVNVLCVRQAGWRATLPAGAGDEAFLPEFANPLDFRLPPREELDFEAVELRLIEMGHGHAALPAIHATVAELQARTADAGGFELEDLLAALRDGGHGDVAGWMEEAITFLKANGGRPATAARQDEAATGADAIAWRSAPHATIDREGLGADGLPRPRPDAEGYASLEEVRFRIAHAFEGGVDVRREHYTPVAALVRPDERVLDVGCGDGTFLELVRERGAKGTGLELDPAKVRSCREKGLEVLECRVQELEREEGTVDFVSMLHIIEHLTPDDALSVLDAACRRLSPAGRIFIVTPNFANPEVAHSNFWLDITHQRPYPKPLLRAMLGALGFPYVQTGTMGDGMDVWCYAFRRQEDAAR